MSIGCRETALQQKSESESSCCFGGQRHLLAGPDRRQRSRWQTAAAR
jgi:hypothetical protein